MEIGVFGGTFDPIHRGHLELAQAALDQLSLDRIIFIPAGQPWLKAGQPVTPAHHRLAMVRLALEHNPAFSVSEMEINRAGPTYTVDTLETLRRELGEDKELHVILGSDVLETFDRWKDPERILGLCRLAVAKRSGVGESEIKGFLDRFPNFSDKVTLLDASPPDIKATDVRHAISRDQAIESNVPDPVVAYIKQFGLYQLGCTGGPEPGISGSGAKV